VRLNAFSNGPFIPRQARGSRGESSANYANVQHDPSIRTGSAIPGVDDVM
jgi:hypothetical protein